MDNYFEIDELFQDLEALSGNDSNSQTDSDSEQELEKRRIRSYRRSRLTPFYKTRKDIFSHFDDDKLYQTFRFDKESIQFILGLIVHMLPKKKTKAKRNLLPIDMLLIALQFYATGTFQTVVGNVLRYSQAYVSRSIAVVSLALSLISKNHIKFPDNLHQLKRDFQEIARMPGVVGCIDGTHITLSRPVKHEKAYVNRKNKHSLNVQGICDANHRFLSVLATKPGSCHDSQIFKNSAIGKRFESGEFGESYLLGDSGYANTTFLFTPYPDPKLSFEIRFNRSHKTTRCTVERSFGILKKRFNVLHGEIRMSPMKVSWITVACCVLHNIALDRNIPMDERNLEEYMNDDEPDPFNDGSLTVSESAMRREGNNKRRAVAQNTFG